MRGRLSVLFVTGVLLLGGCGGDDTDVRRELGVVQDVVVARFNPASSIVPFPNNLVFADTEDGSGAVQPNNGDGTLNIPLSGTGDPSDGPLLALNALDGFSTVAPITTTFDAPIDPVSLNGNSVRVFEVTLSGIAGAVTGIVDELVYGVDFIATTSSVDAANPEPTDVPGDQTLVILPLRPLKPATSYLFALTDGIRGSAGEVAFPDSAYQFTKDPNPLGGGLVELEPVRLLVQAQERAIEAYTGLRRERIVLSWTLTTQSVGRALETVRTVTPADPPMVVADTGQQSPAGAASIFVGTLTLPYYLQAPANATDRIPLSTRWVAANPANAGDTERHVTGLNPLPASTGDQTVPVLLTVPDAGTAPYPVAIFLHGVTANRAAMLAVADSLAAAGFAAIAIDLPLHGLSGNETNGTEAFYAPGFAGTPLAAFATSERTFDVDLITQDPITGATTNPASGDNVVDSSGAHFINLTSLLTTRDNVRQAVADQFALYNALDNVQGIDLDEDNVVLVGHSLGAIVGSVFLALEPGVTTAVLGMPGGGLAKLLDASQDISPQIVAGLAAAGIDKGTAEYEAFFGAAQTAVDSGDPINYAGATGSGNNLLLLEVIGDGSAANPADTVVPNNVGTLAVGFTDAPAGTVPAPLSGTDPLVAAMGLATLDAASLVAGNGAATGSSLVVRFTQGDHRSLVLPQFGLDVLRLMQSMAASFALSGGTAVQVDTTNVPNYADLIE